MIQLALDVPDAIPADRRPPIAAELLVRLAEQEGVVMSKSATRAQMAVGADEIIASVAKFYDTGRLDVMLAGLEGLDDNAMHWISSIGTPTAAAHLGGVDNYLAVARTAFTALAAWAQAHPVLDD